MKPGGEEDPDPSPCYPDRHPFETRRIFQEKTVAEILELVLNEGLGPFERTVELRLDRTYPTCEYRVQYNESDLAFCQRLMEEEGIIFNGPLRCQKVARLNGT